ncbi:MAG: glycosyltransferase family 39 protein [Prolixibacteraceae bacterium]|nr:glycosyltransferase family 39 protein [Prolixibacteraceae bacterium]
MRKTWIEIRVQNYVFFFLILSFVIRLLVAINGYEKSIWNNFADDLGREVYANTIISKGIFFKLDVIQSPESIFAPGIPIVLAIMKVVFANHWFAIFVLNACIGTLSCLVIYLISKEFFNKDVSLLVLLWASFYPSFIRYTATAGNEPWVVFLFSLTMLFALRSIRYSKTYINEIIFALCLTILFHFDERYIVYSLIFSLFLFYGFGSIISKIKKILVFVSFTILFSVPWFIRNYIVYNDIVIISCRTNNLTEPFFHQRKELIFFDHIKDDAFLSIEQIDSVRNGLLNSFSNGSAISKLQIEAMKSGNIPHAFTLSEKIRSRIFFLWVPFKTIDNYRITGYEFNPAWSCRHNLLSGLSYGVLLPFMFLAFYNLIKNRNWEVVLLFGGVLLYHTFIHVAFIPYTRDRYRHPVDFIVIILGVYGISVVYNWFKANKIKKKERVVENG